MRILIHSKVVTSLVLTALWVITLLSRLMTEAVPLIIMTVPGKFRYVNVWVYWYIVTVRSPFWSQCRLELFDEVNACKPWPHMQYDSTNCKQLQRKYISLLISCSLCPFWLWVVQHRCFWSGFYKHQQQRMFLNTKMSTNNILLTLQLYFLYIDFKAIKMLQQT